MRRTASAIVCLAMLPLPALALTPEEQSFVAAYIDAVNSNSTQKHKELVHPDSLACMNDKNKDFFDNAFFQAGRDKIPADAKASFSDDVSVTQILPETLVTFPVKPTQVMQLDYMVGETGITRLRSIAKKDGRIMEVMPCPTEKALVKFRENMEKKAKRETASQERLKTMDEKTKTELLAMIKEGRKSEAIKSYRASAKLPVLDARETILQLEKGMKQ